MNEFIQFANENPICFLATVEGVQPRVRALGFWFADQTGFYFQTATMKDFYHQLKKNPKTEVCFYKSTGMIGVMLRVTGEVEFLEDAKLREKVMIDRPFIKRFGLTAESPELVLFRIPHGEALFWTMDTGMRPKERLMF